MKKTVLCLTLAFAFFAMCGCGKTTAAVSPTKSMASSTAKETVKTLPATDTGKAYVHDASYSEYEYIQLPQIDTSLIKGDSQSINGEIKALYDTLIARDDEKGYFGADNAYSFYEWSQSNGICSIMTEYSHMSKSAAALFRRCDNIDISSGKRLSNDTVISSCGYSYEDILYKYEKYQRAFMPCHLGVYQTEGYEAGECAKEAVDLLKKDNSDKTLGVYANKDGSLGLCLTVFVPAVGEEYYPGYFTVKKDMLETLKANADDETLLLAAHDVKNQSTADYVAADDTSLAVKNEYFALSDNTKIKIERGKIDEDKNEFVAEDVLYDKTLNNGEGVCLKAEEPVFPKDTPKIRITASNPVGSNEFYVEYDDDFASNGYVYLPCGSEDLSESIPNGDILFYGNNEKYIFITAKQLSEGQSASMEDDIDNDGINEQFVIKRDSPNGIELLGIKGDGGTNFLYDFSGRVSRFYDEDIPENYCLQISLFDIDEDGKKEVLASGGNLYDEQETIVYRPANKASGFEYMGSITDGLFVKAKGGGVLNAEFTHGDDSDAIAHLYTVNGIK